MTKRALPVSALPQSNIGFAPAEPAYRYHIELINGAEVEKPMPKKLHTWIQVYLIGALLRLMPEPFEPLSELDLLTGSQTKDGRREWICPDIQVAAKTAKYEEGMLAEPPVLGVEILSPGQTITELFARGDRLVKAGAQNVWVIWPEKRRAWQVGADRIDESHDTLTLSFPAGTKLDSVSIELSEMWKVLDRPE